MIPGTLGARRRSWVAPTGYAGIVAAARPVAYLPLDETGGVPVDRRGIATATLSSPHPPLIGERDWIGDGNHAAYFTGGGRTLISLGKPAALESPAAFSMCAIIKGYSGNNCVAARENSYLLRVVGSKPQFYLYLSGSWVSVAAPTAWDTTASALAHHLAATWNGTTMTLYVDGTAVASTPASGTLGAPAGYNHVIGGRAPASEHWTGQIAGVAYWTRALTAPEVAAISTASKTRSTAPAVVDPATVTLPATPIAVWGLTESGAPYATARGAASFPLGNAAGKTPVSRHPSLYGPFGRALDFSHQQLEIPAESVGALNVGASTGVVTVVAWVRNAGGGAGFGAGVWNEAYNGRSYVILFDMRSEGGKLRVTPHMSDTGGETPGSAFCIDYAATKRLYDPSRMQMFATTYDGAQILAYVDGLTDRYDTFVGSLTTHSANPYYFDKGLNPTPEPFSVGAGGDISDNDLIGQVGGVIVYDRALTPAELFAIHKATRTESQPLLAFDLSYNPSEGDTSTYATGWRKYVPGSAVSMDKDAALNPGMTHYVVGWLTRDAAATGANQPALATFEDIPAGGVTLAELSTATVVTGDTVTNLDAHLALKVGGQWYAVAAPIRQTIAASTTAPETWITHKIALPTTAAGWLSIALTPPPAATTLALGAAPEAQPSGDVTGVGFYFPAYASGVKRIRELRIR